jgi:hypothetical protein
MRPLQHELIGWMRRAPRDSFARSQRPWDQLLCLSTQAREALAELRVMLKHWNGRLLLPF